MTTKIMVKKVRESRSGRGCHNDFDQYLNAKAMVPFVYNNLI